MPRKPSKAPRKPRRTKEYDIFVEQLVSGEAVLRARGTLEDAHQLARLLREDQGCFVQRLGPYSKLNWIALKVNCPSRAERFRQRRR